MNFLGTILIWTSNFSAIVASLYYLINTLEFVEFKSRLLPTAVLNISVLPVSIILAFTVYFDEEFLFNHKNAIVYIIGTFSKYYYFTYIAFYLLSILFLITVFSNLNSKTTNELISILTLPFTFIVGAFIYIIFGLLGYHPTKLFGNFTFVVYNNKLLSNVIFWINFSAITLLTSIFTSIILYLTVKGFKVKGRGITRNISYLLSVALVTIPLLLFDSISVHPELHSDIFKKVVVYSVIFLPTLYSIAYIICDRKNTKEEDVTVNSIYDMPLIRNDFFKFLQMKDNNKSINAFIKWENYKEELLTTKSRNKEDESGITDRILDSMCELEKNFMDSFEAFKTTKDFQFALNDFNGAGALDNELFNARNIFKSGSEKISEIRI